MYTPWSNFEGNTSVNYLIVNRVNKLFDKLFSIVHNNLFNISLNTKAKIKSQEYFKEISDLIYKDDSKCSKYETLQLIARRAYLLKELINKSEINDIDFRCSCYELFWFADELLKLYTDLLLDYALD